MVSTINMQDMRYLNLFGKITQISTRFCFKYNETIIFCVPRMMIPKALGENGANIRKLSQILGKRIRVIASPTGLKDAKSFIESIVSPNTFKGLEINNNEIIITTGSMTN